MATNSIQKIRLILISVLLTAITVQSCARDDDQSSVTNGPASGAQSVDSSFKFKWADEPQSFNLTAAGTGSGQFDPGTITSLKACFQKVPSNSNLENEYRNWIANNPGQPNLCNQAVKGDPVLAKLIFYYTTNEGYMAINGCQRDPSSCTPFSKCAAQLLSYALAQMNQQKATVYRGICASDGLCNTISTNFVSSQTRSTTVTTPMIQQQYCDQGYTSTSTSYDVAEQFAKSCQPGSHPVIFSMNVSGPSVSMCSNYPNENEIILNPGCHPAQTVVNQCPGQTPTAPRPAPPANPPRVTPPPPNTPPVSCPPGSIAWKNSCVTCPAGSTFESGICYACPSGYTFNATTKSCFLAHTPSSACPPGTYASGGGCYSCPSGYVMNTGTGMCSLIQH